MGLEIGGAWSKPRNRKQFSIKTKKIEWMLASGQKVYDSSGKLRFIKTSKCRRCKRTLTWGDRTYDFDHKDNDPSNNSQRNCRLVCKSCHGHVTVVKKRKIKGFFGETVGHETIKRKVGYKKPKKKAKKTKRIAIRDTWGDVIGYRTVKVRKIKTAKKKTIAGKAKKKTATSRSKKTNRKKTTTKRRRKKTGRKIARAPRIS